MKTYIQTPSWRYNNQLELEEEEILMDPIYKINQLKDYHIFLNGVLLFDNWNPNFQTDGDVFPGLYFNYQIQRYYVLICGGNSKACSEVTLYCFLRLRYFPIKSSYLGAE